MSSKIKPIHPGEILKTEFLEPLKISEYHLAKDINISSYQINEIIHNRRDITANIALYLANYFGNSPQFWLNLQARCNKTS